MADDPWGQFVPPSSSAGVGDDPWGQFVEPSAPTRPQTPGAPIAGQSAAAPDDGILTPPCQMGCRIRRSANCSAAALAVAGGF